MSASLSNVVSTTYYRTEFEALRIATIVQEDDPYWSYEVAEYPRGYAILVKDGPFELGTL